MPRSKKTPEQKRRDKTEESELSEFWSNRIEAGLTLKEEYESTAKKVKGYMKPTHRNLFEDEDLPGKFMAFDDTLAVSVPTLSKMKNSLGPKLYLAEPSRNVSYRGADNVLKGLARVLQTYLNYTAKETVQGKQIRKGIDDGLIRGRGFLRQVWDPIRKLITSSYVSSLDVVFDPDFVDPQEAQWVAIRHREPLWQTKRRIAKKALTKDLESLCVSTATGDKDDQEEGKDAGISQTNKIVEYWEILSRMGCGYRGADFDGKDYTDEEDYVRLEVVRGHDRLLDKGPWHVPLYLDRDWPLSWVDFVELPDTQWPESVSGQVLSLQGAVDLLTSLKLTSCKQRERVVLACSDEISKESQNTLKNGSAADFLSLKIPPGRSLEQAIKVLDFGTGSMETVPERAFLLQEMETTMGSTSQVTGGKDSGAQDRSATASQMRNEATETRLGDFKAKVAEFYTDASRKEAVMVRLFLSEEDVSRYVRPNDLALFYVAVEVADAPPLPVRKVSIEDKDGSLVEQEGLTLQDLAPELSTYFDTPEEAAMAMEQFWLNLQSAVDMESVQLRDALVQSGLDPMTNMPSGLRVDVVTAERVWQDTSGMTAEEILDELSYTIETGSGIKFNKDAERANTDNLLQTVLPVVAQFGDVQGLNKLMAMRFDAYDVPEEKRFQFNAPAPMPGQGEGEEEQDEKKPPKKGKGK